MKPDDFQQDRGGPNPACCCRDSFALLLCLWISSPPVSTASWLISKLSAAQPARYMGPHPGQRCDYHRCIALNSIFMSPSCQSVLHRAKKIQKCFHLFFTHRKLTGVWPHAPATSVTRAAVTCCVLLAMCCGTRLGPQKSGLAAPDPPPCPISWPFLHETRHQREGCPVPSAGVACLRQKGPLQQFSPRSLQRLRW